MSAVKELRSLIKEKAGAGDELSMGVQERFGDKPDSLLLKFIRARKFDVARAHELMKGTAMIYCTRVLHEQLAVIPEPCWNCC